jgi:Putative beta-barrel porin-2, OmpL-like. bbp2
MLTNCILWMVLAAGEAPPLAMPPMLPPVASPAPTAGTPPSTTPSNGSKAEALPPPSANGSKEDDKCKKDKKCKKEEEPADGCFFTRLWKAYKDECKKKDDEDDKEPEKPRRSLPQPFDSPFPTKEYQGYPLIGVPVDDEVYPLMKAVYGGPLGDFIKNSGIKAYGWVTTFGDFTDSKNSNSPAAYWLKPNTLGMDQAVLRIERQLDSVQTDHIDVGFRSSFLYGIDYRYMTAGGWFSDQLLLHNRLYGFDPTEQYVDVYIPNIAEGLIIRGGRWIACPDIETQFAPDNYLASHSILFTYDTYTQTGAMFTLKLSDQWTVQVGMNAGNDMAPWYKGAVPCGFAGVRWTSKNNKDSIYTVLNQVDDAKFSHIYQNGQPAGHDNFNYIVTTWQHKFNDCLLTKTEAYFMWQRDGEVGGTPSLGPVQSFGGGGGDGVLLPGNSYAYGVLNYTMLAVSKDDYFTVRNEWYKDERGMRTGFAGNYTSHTIGLSHNFNPVFQVRPEFGYYRNWNERAFDLGTRNGEWIAGFDCTLRF